jgi:hypothetical protein
MKKILLTSIALIVLLGAAAIAYGQGPAKTPDKSVTSVANGIIVYYFHNNYRCPSCKKIEIYTSETVKTKFADDIKKGLITWQMVNVDEPANKHFIKEYKIITKQVVLVEMKKGSQTRWKNLDKIWELLGDQAKFGAYIESELKVFEGKS